MALFQQLFLSSSTTTTTFFIMNKTLQGYTATCLHSSPFSSSLHLSTKLTLSSVFTPIHHPTLIKLNPPLKLSPILNHATWTPSLSALNLRYMCRPLLSYTPLLGAAIPSSTTAFRKRFFSKVPRPVTSKNNVTQAGTGNNNKSSKSLAAHGRNGMFSKAPAKSTSLSHLSAAKDVDVVTSKEKLLEDVSLESSASVSKDQPTKPKPKVKRQPRTKKDKQQVSEANAPSVSADKSKRVKKVSKANKSNLTKDDKSLTASEISSAANASVEVLETNVSAATDCSKPTTKSPRRQRKSKKEAETPEKSSETPLVQAGNKLIQNGKPQPQTVKPQKQKILPQLYPPTAKSVVVVESMTKSKVIQGYLGGMYEVLPSYGHVRDLAARSGSVRPDDDFSMVWEVPSPAWTHLKSIKVALTGAKNLILASDPDREGEAIAWHIIEMLQQQDALHEDITVARVVFNEITESSIKSALQAPRHIDVNLVDAYLARRALDYLIGFNISPLLWRKLPGCQSAGRVQSAALALICDREMEIDNFKPQEYWTVEVEFGNPNGLCFSSHLTHFESEKLNQFSISSHTEAANVEKMIDSSNFEVLSSKRSKSRRNPPTPFITSTLQQDAANRLHFSAAYTMKLAQKLYEGVQLSGGEATGLITYMRTDGLHISDQAVKDIQTFVTERYGDKFASKGPRKYLKKVKNAQEAHEAIRPTDIRRLPSTLVGVLDEDSLKLYTLIWSRTTACQMEPATINQIQLDIGNSGQSIIFRSTCSKVEFLGYQAVNKDVETSTIRAEEDEAYDRSEVFNSLSSLKSGESLRFNKVELKQHHTQPPPRYSEGSLVKKLEELGIGRPSTYASTIKVLKDRNYVTAKGRTLYPEFRGRMVSAYLSHYFSEVTDYSFTADMETELDNISAGLTEWKGLLKDYWTRFSKYCELAGSVHIHQVEKMLEKAFGDFLFSSLPDASRTCPSCSQGTLIFKVSRFGAGYFIGCDQHPKCKYIAKTLYGEDDEDITPEDHNKIVEEPKLLGLNPNSKEKVLLKNGPYGYYVQLGEDRKGYLPKRASVAQIKDVMSITLEDALELLQYPVTLGNHPDDGKPVILKLARFGFAIRHRRTIAPVPKNMKPSEITLEKALPLLVGKDVKRCGRPTRKKPVAASL